MKADGMYMIRKCLVSIFEFYRDGFRSMTWGRTLWVIILLKLFVMFFVLRAFFFTPYLEGKSDDEKQRFVGEELIERGVK